MDACPVVAVKIHEVAGMNLSAESPFEIVGYPQRKKPRIHSSI